MPWIQTVQSSDTGRTDFIQENITQPAVAVYDQIKIQLANEKHPLVQTSKLFSSSFVRFYSKYTGVGVSNRLTDQQKKEMFKQLIADSKALREMWQSQGGNTEINMSIVLDDFERIEDETRILSISALATDELYIV